jgi:hypothetical protein
MKTLIIIPTYNEAETIQNQVQISQQVLNGLIVFQAVPNVNPNCRSHLR